MTGYHITLGDGRTTEELVAAAKYGVKETLNSTRQIILGSLPILGQCPSDARMPAGNVPARGRQTLPDPVPAPLIAPEA